LLIDLWKNVFPNDPPQNEPSKVIDQKLAVDDMIFIAEYDNKVIGACIAGYDGLILPQKTGDRVKPFLAVVKQQQCTRASR